MPIIKIDLPVLPLETPVTSAMAAMLSNGRAAVITVDGKEVRIVRAKAILDALRSKITPTLGEIAVENVTTRNVKLTTKPAFNEKWTVTIGQAAQGVRAGREGVMLSKLGIGNAVIIMNNTEMARQIAAAPRECYCEDPAEHGFDRNNHPLTCPFDGTRIRC